ncbi:DNA-3-methyladenine glycosylase family protein [Prauserella oleivorans]|uniref:DNA-3-methyladenine glycosylase family protein n=1 Tax=Prauserella oleivorans TaxID=1478153 RepID=A0ABW5WFC1_9PSEU
MGTDVAGPVSVTEMETGGDFDLDASAWFAATIAPTIERADREPGTLRLAFPVERAWEPVGVYLHARTPRLLEVTVDGPPASADEAMHQVRRILSLDVDASGFADVAARDPVLAGVWRRHRAVRPVLFPSPYEAACWAVVCHRLRLDQARRALWRIVERYGTVVTVGGRECAAFPAPEVLRDLGPSTGLSAVKRDRLAVIGDAARAGLLDGRALRAMPAEDALDLVRQLPGIGPFSAELVVARGAGHPDVFPRHEHGLLGSMAAAYGTTDATALADIADRWRPYRSWAAFLLRIAGSADAEKDETVARQETVETRRGSP